MIHEIILQKLLGYQENLYMINIVPVEKCKFNIYENGHPAFNKELSVNITEINTSEEYFLTSDGEKYSITLLNEIHFL